MSLYYCFNGLFDFEYPVTQEDIIKAIKKINGIVIEREAVKFYMYYYLDEILRNFIDEAYWEYLGETKADFISDKNLIRHMKTMREEDEIFGVNKNGRL